MHHAAQQENDQRSAQHIRFPLLFSIGDCVAKENDLWKELMFVSMIRLPDLPIFPAK
jgi:hypothetical protein